MRAGGTLTYCCFLLAVRACAYVSPVSYYLFLSMVGCYSHYNYDGETKSPEDGGEDERQVVSDISSLFSFNLA